MDVCPQREHSPLEIGALLANAIQLLALRAHFVLGAREPRRTGGKKHCAKKGSTYNALCPTLRAPHHQTCRRCRPTEKALPRRPIIAPHAIPINAIV